jgi:outer membrane protein assembly factor BamB
MVAGVGALLLAGANSNARAQAPSPTDPPVPAAEAWKVGWPSVVGPTGNGLPLRTDTPLVDDLARAKLLWVSEDASLGSAKTGSQTWVNSARVESFIGPEPKQTKGNWAGVIVIDGRVFGSSWVPAGPVYTGPYKTNKPYEKGPTPEVPTRFRVEADDIVVCFDASTGKVLWKATEPGGLIRAGGKRGGFQVGMAGDGTRVFALGSTGRLFAYDAATGRKLWQGDIGPAHQLAVKEKEESIATARGGKVVIPDAPGWMTSLVVADGVLVSGDFRGTDDIGLRGYDAATGELKWQLPSVISKYATPSVWRHAGKAWLLTATLSGTLSLIDPQTGKPAWQVAGLGRNLTTLGPGDDTVLVNVKPGTGKRQPGLWGAYRLAPTKAEKLWQLEDEPRNQFSTWMDDGARQHAYVRGGRALVHTQGTKEAPGRVLLLDANTGKVLAEAPNGGDDLVQMDELILWLGDRAIVRADHSHGALHGGRHPMVPWHTEPGSIAPIKVEGKPTALDLVDFDTAYEVLMHVPLVDGRIYERVDDGRLACYDLRAPRAAAEWKLGLRGAYAGMVAPVPVRLSVTSEGVHSGSAWIADGTEVGIPAGTVRRRFYWEDVDVAPLKRDGDQIAGTARLSFGTHAWPVNLSLTRNASAVTGEWTRSVPGLPETKQSEGRILGWANDVRGYPTPWLKETPWSPIGTNPPGTRTYVLGLDGAIPLRDPPKGLNVCLDHDGKAWTRAAGAAFQYSQAWHEVDPSQLKLEGGRITGTIAVVLNVDPYLIERDAGRGAAARIEIDATLNPDNTITGTYKATWGVPLEMKGAVEGTVER